MAWLDALPVATVAGLIFCLRIVDVSFGTLRTISVVHGRVRLSVVLGFFEVLVWITAVSQVITRINQSPLLVLAYPAGFAAGNAVGILLERRLRLGSCVVRIITATQPEAIAAALRSAGHDVTTFAGQGASGPRTLIYTTSLRRDLADLIRRARAVDPSLTFAVERFSETSATPLPHATGWRGVLKMK